MKQEAPHEGGRENAPQTGNLHEHCTASAETTQKGATLAPDLDQAERFLTLLDESAKWFTFQTFAETPEAKTEESERERNGQLKRYARVRHGTLEQHAAELRRLNEAGAGVFVTVNKTDGKGRKAHNITGVRAVFVDMDGSPLDPVTGGNLEPHIIAESSPDRWHLYYLTEGLALGEFEGIQRALIERFASDPSVHDLPRVMRLPGFYHRKGEPRMVQVIHESGAQPFDADTIRAEFPAGAGNGGTKRHERLSEIDATDPIVCALRDRGLIRGQRRDGAYNIGCPFQNEHTTASNDSETVYYPPRTGGYKTARIHCLHAHCSGRSMDEYRNALGITNDAPETTGGDWPEPADLFGKFTTPSFPVETIPEPIHSFVKDQADLIGVDPAILVMTALAATAGCLDDRIEIQPKRHDPTWTESARLWIGVIGDPSTKKSPALKKGMGPVRKIATEWRKQAQRELKAWKKKCDRLKKEDKDADLPEAPIVKRLTANDVTVEKLSAILSTTEPRGIIIDKDELTGWLASMDAYKQGAGGKDKAQWLEAYNGGPYEIDRVTRGSVFVPNWSATVVGGIQPQVIAEYANTNNHDGMLQRFVLVYAQSASRGIDRTPDMRAKQAYGEMMEQIVAYQPGSSPVKLSEAAHEVREAFNDRLHTAITSMPNPHLTAALGKWEGLFARVCLTLHAAECAHQRIHPVGEPVSAETAANVDRLLWRCLLPHAIRFYNGLDPTEDHARQLAGLLLSRTWDRFTVKRDLHNNMLVYRKLKDNARDEMLDRLEAYGWIAPEPGKVNERGRPAAYSVNPAIHARYADQAEREKERRHRVAGIMRDLREPEQ